MSIIDIIIFAAIGYFGYKIYTKRKAGNTESGDSERQLTDTQINWRQQKAQMLQENPEQYDPNYDPLNEETNSSVGTLTRQSSFLDVQKYIKDNKRPFKFLEWLSWDMDSRFLRRYIINVGIFLAIWFMPMIFGVGASIGFAFTAFIVLDIVLYGQQRVLEITDWNPEFVNMFNPEK